MSIHTRLTRVHAAGGRPDLDQHDDDTLVDALARLRPRLTPDGNLLLVHVWFVDTADKKTYSDSLDTPPMHSPPSSGNSPESSTAGKSRIVPKPSAKPALTRGNNSK